MAATSVILLSWCGIIQPTYYNLKKIFYAAIQLKMS